VRWDDAVRLGDGILTLIKSPVDKEGAAARRRSTIFRCCAIINEFTNDAKYCATTPTFAEICRLHISFLQDFNLNMAMTLVVMLSYFQVFLRCLYWNQYIVISHSHTSIPIH